MLDIALKEWAVVCDLLLEGRSILLLRKGGIHESGGPGVFELEHPRFLLFPSWLHQKSEMMKPTYRERVKVFGKEPATITFAGLAEVARIWPLRDRAPFAAGRALDGLHPWMPAHIDMRFDYRPENPLYLLALRVSRLATPKTVANHAEYAGCKSWVPLRPGDEVEDRGARPVLDDAAFAALLTQVEAGLA